MKLEKYSMGIGDRFAQQGHAQIQAFVEAKKQGVTVIPVWNKSNREHTIVGTVPADTRKEANEAVRQAGWTDSFRVDADHIGLQTVDRFLDVSDFFTVDVADFINEAPASEDLQKFLKAQEKWIGDLNIPGISETLKVTPSLLEGIGKKYLLAVKKAGEIYRKIESAKGKGNFITEVSMDESNDPQTPLEMFFILAALAQEGVPVQTIAPKFSGRFNKGVDYVGNPTVFEKEFEQDVAVIAFAVQKFGLPSELKMSVHSGSDKFSIYGPIHRVISKTGAGLHLKTAGTTWLEEVIGLALGDESSLKLVRKIYRIAYGRQDELSKPYATVIDVDKNKLPTPDQADGWTGTQYADALRHEPKNPAFNLHFRQMLHVSFKVAAELGAEYLNALQTHRVLIGKCVSDNLYRKHMAPIFLGKAF